MDRKRADRRQFHYIYKITRFDGKYYIGLHSTDNLEDGYFGSGKYITRSIKYHGREKHTKEILEFLPDRESLKKREVQIVNEECLNDPLCMNLKLGGEGGWNYVNKTSGNQGVRLNRFLSNEKRSKGGKLGGKLTGAINGKKNTGVKCIGNRHTEEYKKHMSIIMSEKMKGTGNSQYGTRWIHNPELQIVKKIRKDEEIPMDWYPGRKLP